MMVHRGENPGKPFIVFDGVSKKFGARVIYANLDLEIRRGETITVRAGSRLVLLGVDARDLGSAAEFLAQQNILTYSGTVGFGLDGLDLDRILTD